MSRWGICLLHVACWAMLAQAAPAPQEPPGKREEAVQEVHRVLARGWMARNHPWYDEQTGEVRPYVLPPKKAASSGPSLWDRFRSWLREKWTSLTEWLASSAWEVSIFGYKVVFTLYQVVLVLLAAIVIWVLVRLLRRWYAATLARQEAKAPVERAGRGTPERIDQLPVAVSTGSEGLWQLVQQAMAQKRYSRAIVFLYSYLLLQLDRHGRIHLEKGRTNRQYLRQLRGDPQLQRMMSRIVTAFEDAFFGHRELSAQGFQQCWELVPRIQQHMQRGRNHGA